MEEIGFVSSLRHCWRNFPSVFLAAVMLFVAVTTAQSAVTEGEIPDSPSPILISAPDSTRALAANADIWRNSLPRKNSEVFQPGARAVIFVTNLDLMNNEGANALRVYGQDAGGRQYRFVVENIRQINKQNWIYAVTVRLFDENEYNGQPQASGDLLIRLTWRGMTSNRVRLGLGTTGGKIKDDEGAAPTPAPLSPPAKIDSLGNQTGADRKRFMEQATFGPHPAVDLRLRQIGMRRWIDEQFAKPQTYPYPDMPLMPLNVPSPCGDTPNVPVNCVRDRYSQYQNQNWMVKEALYGEDQLRRRVSWALHQIWVVSGVDTQQSRHLQEYYEILDRNAFGNYKTLMKEMTLNPAMGNYLDMIRSTRSNPNENYPREILQLFAVGLDMLNPDGTPILDGQGNRIPTYDQEKVNNFTKVFTGWTACSAAPPACPNNPGGGIPNFIDPMMLVGSQHDLTAKTLFNYPGAPFPTIPACTGCTTDATRVPYANNSLDQTIENIFHHPNVAPFVSKLMIQHMVMSDPSPAYVGRVARAFEGYYGGEATPSFPRGDMRNMIRAILLDPEARGSRKTDPNYGKLREPLQLATNLLRHFDVRSSDRTQNSDGYINPQMSNLGQNIWNPPTVFNYFPPDYIVPGTDIVGPEFGITNTGTSFNRINFISTMVFQRINCTGSPACNPDGNTPLGTSLSFAEPQSWAAADPSGNLLIENLNAKLMHGAMSNEMKNTLRTAIAAVPETNTLLRAQQAVYLIASSSQYQVQR